MIRVLYTPDAASTIQPINVRPVQRTANNTVDTINREKDIYLIYFRSDMSGRVCYAYVNGKYIDDYGPKRSNYQYTELSIDQVNLLSLQDVYNGKVQLNPPGYWYYIIYEVNFPNGTEIEYLGQPFNLISKGYAPIDNIGTYEEKPEEGPSPSIDKGVLGIAVEEGKMFVKEVPPEGGTYTEHNQINNNYIYTK
tara:strand:+ start:2496 stop:3077 length:582 start_codon:yes stop_codon:yes gene_type:complete